MASGHQRDVELTLTLCLPRDAASVPLSRRVASELLKSVGFHTEDVGDVELAMTEACSNVLRHSGAGDEYDLHLTVDGSTVVIEIEDKGPGFPEHLSQLGTDDADTEAETGRGIQLMRALVDDLRFERAPNDGAVVRMVRQMRTEPGSPAAAILLGGC